MSLKNKLTPEKYFLALSAIIVVTIGSLIFIYLSNDHVECETVTKTRTVSDGKIVTTKRHYCKEKFSF
jgi:hypothetical protein